MASDTFRSPHGSCPPSNVQLSGSPHDFAATLRLAQVGGDPRGAVAAPVGGEQPADLDPEPGPAGVLRRGVPVRPLVEPGLADAQRPTRGRVWDPVFLPLGGDEGGHGYRPIA